MKVLVKIGGAPLDAPIARQRFASAVASARAAGHELVVVHGGGNQVGEVCGSMGITPRKHKGLRITDAATAEVVLMVLGGAVNRRVVAALQSEGVPSVGLTGADGGLFRAARVQRDDVDLGFVGEVREVDARPVNDLLAAGYTPVVASVAPGSPEDADVFLNINADHAVAPLAAALGCDAVLFLTDVSGVRDATDAVIPALDANACDELIATGVATGGMQPKLESALAAASLNPGALVKIAPADVDDAVLAALEAGVGTRFVATEAIHG